MKASDKKLTLPVDATVASVLGGLAKPKEYVRFVLQQMHEAKADQVRVWLCGSASNPPFMLEMVIEDDDREHWIPLSVFDGASRSERYDEGIENWAGWSMGRMLLGQIKGLMGDLNGWKGPRPKVARP